VPKLPGEISHILIENLPPSAGLGSDIPDDVLNAMTDHQLATLFYRPDIGLLELRKKMFLEVSNERDNVRCSAICYNFDLEYPEFQAILAKPGEEKVRDLRVLATMARDLSLCLFDAIHDALFNTNVGLFGGWEDAEFARDALKRKLATLQGWQRKEELRELRLYRLARRAVPWKETDQGYPPSGELAFLAESMVQGDTWGTFMAFSKEWRSRSWQTKKLVKHLPAISEALEDDLEYDRESDDNGLLEDAEPTSRIEERLTEMLSTLTTKMGDVETYLAEAIGKITSEITVWQRENIAEAIEALKIQVDRIEEQVVEILSAPTAETNDGETYFAEVTSWQEKIIETINSLKMQITNLEISGRRQKVLSYLVIGLLVLLILIMT
jgi:hypothetical protein